MAITLRSATTTMGRKMAGARSLWRANGMTEEQIGKPIIGIVNSFTQFVPGHVHLHEIGPDGGGLTAIAIRERAKRTEIILLHGLRLCSE